MLWEQELIEGRATQCFFDDGTSTDEGDAFLLLILCPLLLSSINGETSWPNVQNKIPVGLFEYPLLKGFQRHAHQRNVVLTWHLHCYQLLW